MFGSLKMFINSYEVMHADTLRLTGRLFEKDRQQAT